MMMTIDTFAKATGYSKRSILRMIEGGKLTYHRVPNSRCKRILISSELVDQFKKESKDKCQSK